jgi:hypothetical protein
MSFVVVALLVLGWLVAAPTAGRAAQACGTSANTSICLVVPDGPLSGEEPISVTVSGSTTGITALRFSWGTTSTTSTPLLRDFRAPYGFLWPTDKFLDATQWLNVRVQRGSTVGNPVSLQVTIENGNDTSVPQNPTDWPAVRGSRPFTGDPVVAAAGDSGDGTPQSEAVAASILGSEASLFLFLGDVYETGTVAEWDVNYGRSSLEDGVGRSWGALASWTRPTLGNHEGANIPVWRNYWHGHPDYEAFVHGGVLFLNANSECTLVPGGCAVGSPQYTYFQQVLAANTLPCVVGMWHKPPISVRDNPTMNPIWALIANNGGDLVLNGHEHHMQRFLPMNASLQAGQSDSHMIELVSGAGSHGLTSTADTDARSAWQQRGVAGSAYLTLVDGGTGAASAISWQFRDQNGVPVPASASSVACADDEVSPTAPGKPSGSSAAPGQISLSWTAAEDDVASSLTYRVYRDDDPTSVGTVVSGAATVGFTDTNLAPGSIHTYEVEASDGTNTGPRSVRSDPITVQQGPSALIADGFTGGLSGWTVTNVTLDATRFPSTGAAPSARMAVSGVRGWARRALPSPVPGACMSFSVDVTSSTGSVALAKLRTAGNVQIGRVFLAPGRVLKVRADVTGQVFSSGLVLPTGWHRIELCGRVGTSGTLRLSLDGAVRGSWTVNNGTTSIGAVQFGDDTAKTFTANVDDVTVVAW